MIRFIGYALRKGRMQHSKIATTKYTHLKISRDSFKLNFVCLHWNHQKRYVRLSEVSQTFSVEWDGAHYRYYY